MEVQTQDECCVRLGQGEALTKGVILTGVFLLLFFGSPVRGAEQSLVELVREHCEIADQSALSVVEHFANRSIHKGDEWGCIKALEPLITQKPDPLLHLIIGVAACERNLYRFAQGHLEKAVAGLPEKYQDYPELRFATDYWLGKALLGQGEDARGKECITRALDAVREQPDNKSLFWNGKTFCEILARSLAARLLFDYQHEKEALELLVQIGTPVDSARYRPEGYLPDDLAVCYAAVGDSKKAVECYQQALKRDNLCLERV